MAQTLYFVLSGKSKAKLANIPIEARYAMHPCCFYAGELAMTEKI